MKKLLLIALILVLGGCSGNLAQQLLPIIQIKSSPTESSSNTSSAAEEFRKVADHSQQQIQIGDHLLTVEVVNTNSSISQGLSGRRDIGSDGMLFVFPSRQQISFWMPEMLFDLDLVWIVEDKVIGVTEQVPHPLPNTPLDQLPTYPPPSAVEMVLEIEAGKAAELNLQPGHTVQRATE